jgi:hypothetical protein
LWLRPEYGGYTYPDFPWQFRLFGKVTPDTVHAMIAITILAGVLMTVGLAGRIPILVAQQGFLALINLNSDATGGHDLVISNALWLLVFSRSTATLSLDCKIWTGSWTSNRLVPAWPRYVMIVQLVLIYWSTGAQKVSATWTPVGGFSALYYVLQQPTWQRMDMSWLAWIYPLTQIGTAVSWLWEVTSPLLLLALWYRATRDRPGWLRRTFNRVNFRRIFVTIGLIVHLGILVFLEVGPFTWIMLACYACLYGPEEWRIRPPSSVPGPS